MTNRARATHSSCCVMDANDALSKLNRMKREEDWLTEEFGPDMRCMIDFDFIAMMFNNN